MYIRTVRYDTVYGISIIKYSDLYTTVIVIGFDYAQGLAVSLNIYREVYAAGFTVLRL